MGAVKTYFNKLFVAVPYDSKENRLITLLLLYVYSPLIRRLTEGVVNLGWFFNFAFDALLIVLILLLNQKVKRSVLAFLLSFSAVVIINFWVVDYRYYVATEGIIAFLKIAIPCLAVSSEYFDLDHFLSKWYKFASWNWILLLPALLLLKLQIVNYAIFTEICVPNVFILSFSVLRKKYFTEKLYIPFIIAIANIVPITLFGGRMAAFVCVFMIGLAFFFSNEISIKIKLAVLITFAVLSLVLFLNLEWILFTLQNILEKLNMNSRTLNLLIKQLNSNEWQLSGRGSIYTLSLEYIKDHVFLPGGFGVPLHITNGKYYYTHNIILQFLVTFGLPGSVIIVFLTFLRLQYIKKVKEICYYKFLIFTFVSYLPVGITGSSIWIHFLSTLFIAVLFFSATEKPLVEDAN